MPSLRTLCELYIILCTTGNIQSNYISLHQSFSLATSALLGLLSYNTFALFFTSSVDKRASLLGAFSPSHPSTSDCWSPVGGFAPLIAAPDADPSRHAFTWFAANLPGQTDTLSLSTSPGAAEGAAPGLDSLPVHTLPVHYFVTNTSY